MGRDEGNWGGEASNSLNKVKGGEYRSKGRTPFWLTNRVTQKKIWLAGVKIWCSLIPG